MPARAPGKIILAHGASSSGKTTLCRALEARLDAPFRHYSIDHFRGSGALPTERIDCGDFDWSELRQAFFDGFHRCLPALAAPGKNLVVEHIVETREWLLRLVRLLAGCDVFFVGLRCPLAELEARERQKGAIGGRARPAGITRSSMRSRHTTSRSTRRAAPTTTSTRCPPRGGRGRGQAPSSACGRRTTATASDGAAVRPRGRGGTDRGARCPTHARQRRARPRDEP